MVVAFGGSLLGIRHQFQEFGSLNRLGPKTFDCEQGRIGGAAEEMMNIMGGCVAVRAGIDDVGVDAGKVVVGSSGVAGAELTERRSGFARQ